eukprot:gnl/TRDRNA2_/TRDRNA2_85273_c1_seq1.p1 gnl/TRDRNA2_/TRDRNA2_85273_c1~~gnl/TRDRNA2_/TRDRNA2_85273_c1_seq1.p1  ORF type:complete len:563 (+),score=87.30 gnl/TRDRNA2_/TRDRNA2_85273_c1_seq1:165-1691(+)
MAPEVFAGSYDERADCWSLGVVAYEVLFGYRPFNDSCIARIEEMVRNWDRYLLLPSDAAEAPATFVRELLAERSVRLSSAAASKHDWLKVKGSCQPEGGTPGDRQQTRRSIDFESSVDQEASLSPAKPQQLDRRAFQDSSGIHFRSSNCQPDRRLPRTTGLFCSDRRNDEVEHLASIRRSLSEWSQLWDLPPIAAAQERRSCQDDGIHKDPTNAHAAAAAGAAAASAVAAAAAKIQGSAASSSPSPDAGLSARIVVGDTEHAFNQSASAMSPRRIGALPSFGPSSTADVDEGGEHFSYLRRVHARNLELCKSAAEAAALASSSIQPTRCHSHIREAVGCNSHFASSSSASAVSTDRLATGSDDDVLLHLRGAQAKTKELLRRLSAPAAAESVESDAGEGNSCMRRSVPTATTEGWPEDSPARQFEDAVADYSSQTSAAASPQSPESPNSWLVGHKRRTESLLSSLKFAAEHLESGRTADDGEDWSAPPKSLTATESPRSSVPWVLAGW